MGAILSILLWCMLLIGSGAWLNADVIFDAQRQSVWDKDVPDARIQVTDIGVSGTPPAIQSTLQIIPPISRDSH